MAAAVEAFVGEVRTALGRVEAQIAALTERIDRAEAQIQENGRQIAALTEQVRLLTRQVESLRGDVGFLMGRDFESQFRKMAPAVFRGGGDLRSALHRALSGVKQATA